MKYRNELTGVVVDVQSKIKVGVWVPVEEPAPIFVSEKKTAPARKKREVKK